MYGFGGNGVHMIIASSSDPVEVSDARAKCNQNSRLASKGQGVMKKNGKPDVPCHFFMLSYRERHENRE